MKKLGEGVCLIEFKPMDNHNEGSLVSIDSKYSIYKFHHRYSVFTDGIDGNPYDLGDYNTLSDAKQACQTHYEAKA